MADEWSRFTFAPRSAKEFIGFFFRPSATVRLDNDRWKNISRTAGKTIDHVFPSNPSSKLAPIGGKGEVGRLNRQMLRKDVGLTGER